MKGEIATLRKYPLSPDRRRKSYGARTRKPRQGTGKPPWGGVIWLALAIGLGVALLSSELSLKRLWQCDIKGNISASGEKIYHVPGQKYYRATRINRSRGERWFCSEEEA